MPFRLQYLDSTNEELAVPNRAPGDGYVNVNHTSIEAEAEGDLSRANIDETNASEFAARGHVE